MNNLRLTRRDFLRLSAASTGMLLVGCLPVAAPGAQESQQPAADGKASIQFWWGWTPELHVKAINAAVDKFMEQNPDVEVSTGQHEWGERLYTALAAGTPPDLFNFGPPAEWAARDAIIPLDDYMSKSDIANQDAFPDAMIVQGTWRGKVYGIPGCENFALLGIGFNQRLLKEAGMSGTVDDLPKTWAESLEQVKEYSKIDAAGNIDLLWYKIEQNDWAEHGALIGIDTYDAENEKFNFDHPGWVEYFQWLKDYYDFLGVDKIASFFDSYPGWSAVPGCSMCVGRQAGGQNGYWWPGELTNTAPDEHFVYTWNPMPASRAGVKLQMIGIHHNMVTKDSPNPEAAWRLAEYLTTNEAIKIIFDGTGFLIPTKRLMEDPASVVDIDKYDGLRFYAESLSQADELVPYPACPIDAICYDQMQKAIDAVAYGDKSIEQSLADLQSTLTEELAKALKTS